MKKIVIFLSMLGTGGAERVCITLANWIASNTESEVYLITFDKNKNIYEIDEKVHFNSLEVRYSNKIDKVFKRFKLLKKALNKIAPDVVFTVMFSSIAYSLLCSPKRTRIITSERCNNKARNKVIAFLYQVMLSKCDGIIFQTKRAGLDYSKKIRNKSIVIPNAVSKTYKRTASDKKKNIIISVGRLAYQKGFDTLIKAFMIFREKHNEYQLHIYGDGPDKSSLLNLCNELMATNYVFLKGISNEAIKYVSEAKIFVLSSRFEGMPNALLEAMSTGTACISTNCDYGPDEIINDGRNGFLVPVDNINELANKMTYLADNSDTRIKFEDNAIKINETNNPDVIYKKYYDYLVK